MSLIVVQHSRTLSSEQGRVADDGELLMTSGRMDAVKTGRAALALLDGESFNAVLSSTAMRATQTSEVCSLVVGLGGRYIREPYLDPRGMGKFVGRQAADVPWDDEEALVAHGVEPIDDLIWRTTDLFAELRTKRKWRNKNILLVTHTSSIPILGQLAGLAAEQSKAPRGEALFLG